MILQRSNILMYGRIFGNSDYKWMFKVFVDVQTHCSLMDMTLYRLVTLFFINLVYNINFLLFTHYLTAYQYSYQHQGAIMEWSAMSYILLWP